MTGRKRWTLRTIRTYRNKEYREYRVRLPLPGIPYGTYPQIPGSVPKDPAGFVVGRTRELAGELSPLALAHNANSAARIPPAVIIFISPPLCKYGTLGLRHRSRLRSRRISPPGGRNLRWRRLHSPRSPRRLHSRRREPRTYSQLA